MNELDEHMAKFKAAYARFPALDEKRRVEWAEQVASSTALQLIYSVTGPVLYGKYAAEDYLSDDKPRMGGEG